MPRNIKKVLHKKLGLTSPRFSVAWGPGTCLGAAHCPPRTDFDEPPLTFRRELFIATGTGEKAGESQSQLAAATWITDAMFSNRMANGS